MKKTIYTPLLAAVTSLNLISCGPKCKTCEAELMGVKSGASREFCGDELKQAEASGMFKCK